MRRLLLALLLSACGVESDRHCIANWTQGSRATAACGCSTYPPFDVCEQQCGVCEGACCGTCRGDPDCVDGTWAVECDCARDLAIADLTEPTDGGPND